MFGLTEESDFPPVELADEDGLLAIGGDLSVSRLKQAYQRGIFPWPENDEFLLWWSPDPRFVLYPEKLKVSKSMKKLFRDQAFEVSYNQAFDQVITHCQQQKREGQEGTWITNSILKAYNELHREGIAKSVEVWQGKTLVAGLYGVEIGDIFCGESMFTHVSNASKYGLIDFVQRSSYKLIDCQTYTDHLKSLGAEFLSREAFLSYLP